VRSSESRESRPISYKSAGSSAAWRGDLDILKGSRHTIIVENNFSGQFATLSAQRNQLRAEWPHSQVRWRTVHAHHIVEAVKEQLAGKTKLSVPVHEIMV